MPLYIPDGSLESIVILVNKFVYAKQTPSIIKLENSTADRQQAEVWVPLTPATTYNRLRQHEDSHPKMQCFAKAVAQLG